MCIRDRLSAMLHRIQISTSTCEVTMQVKRAIGKATLHILPIYNEHMRLCLVHGDLSFIGTENINFYEYSSAVMWIVPLVFRSHQIWTLSDTRGGSYRYFSRGGGSKFFKGVWDGGFICPLMNLTERKGMKIFINALCSFLQRKFSENRSACYTPSMHFIRGSRAVSYTHLTLPTICRV